MQFIPSTWSVVGVDGDGDGKRNPQDIDDAALASAVYLCSGDEDLSTDAGQNAAVYRYNHSDAYVDLVKQIAAAYAAGDYYAAPTSSYAAPYFQPYYDDSVFNSGTSGWHPPKTHGPKTGGTNQPPTTDPTTPTEPTDTDNDPTTPAKDPAKTLNDVITKAPETVKNTVTELQKATNYCLENLTQAQLNLLGGVQACAEAYLDGGVNAINNLLDALGLGGLIGGLLKPSNSRNTVSRNKKHPRTLSPGVFRFGAVSADARRPRSPSRSARCRHRRAGSTSASPGSPPRGRASRPRRPPRPSSTRPRRCRPRPARRRLARRRAARRGSPGPA